MTIQTRDTTIKYRHIILIALSSASLVVIVLMILLYANEQYNQPSAQVRDYLYDMLQSMSIQKPFNFTIFSANRAKHTLLAGDVWCFVITPSFQESKTSDKINHLVVVKSNPQWWGGLVPENNQKAWNDEGCGNW